MLRVVVRLVVLMEAQVLRTNNKVHEARARLLICALCRSRLPSAVVRDCMSRAA
jgi:hypothetical protein